MKSSHTFRFSPKNHLRRSLWLLPLVGFFFLIGDKAPESQERENAISQPQTAPTVQETAEKDEFRPSSVPTAPALVRKAPFELESPHLDLSADQVEEWVVKNGFVEGILRLKDGRRVVFSAGSDTGDRFVVQSAAIAGEYIIRTADLPRQKWEGAGLLGEQGIEILRSTPHLTQLRVPAKDLERIEQWEQLLFQSVGERPIGRNSLVYPSGAPNDPEYANSWELAKLDLEPVWATYGFSPESALGRRPVIAVVDNGAAERDLHTWINGDEIPGNGVDDDDNGYIDDVSGYNFVRNSGDVSFSGGHGGKVARIAASLTNNETGTASPASSAALMRVLYYEQSAGTHFSAISGILYAATNGADVINCSFITDSSTLFSWAIDQAAATGAVVVAAAGNGNTSLDKDFKYPASCTNPNLITVGASNKQDERQNSKYSATQVEIFAPAGATSFSTPLVTSTIALMRTIKPEATPEEMIAAIVDGADRVPALEGLCRSKGRLNVRGAVESLLGTSLTTEVSAPPPTEPEVPKLTEATVSETTVHLAWTSSGSVDGFEIEYCKDSAAFEPLESTSVVEGSARELLVENLPEGAEVVFRIRSLVETVSSEWTCSSTLSIPVSYKGPMPVAEDPPVHEAAPGSPLVINPEGAPPSESTDPGPTDTGDQIEYSAPQLGEDGNIIIEIPEPAHFWDFEEGQGSRAADIGYGAMPMEVSSASWGQGVEQGSAIVFTGEHHGIHIDNSSSINLSKKGMMTIAFWVRPRLEQLDNTSLLYEQGGYRRGLNVILEKGRLKASGWNRPENESGWQGTTLHGGELLMGEWNHIALVLEGGNSIKGSGLRLFVNGKFADSGPGSQLWVDTGGIGLGQVNGTTVHRNKGVRSLDPFQGAFDDLAIWEAPFFGAQIEEFILLSTE